MGEDTNDDEVERFAEKLRRQRLEETKEAESSRFGRVYPIGREDYTREVTEASKVAVLDDPGRGTGVVCLLYKDGYVLFQPGLLPILQETGCHAVRGHSNTLRPWRSATQRPSLFPSWATSAYQTFQSQDNPC